MTKPKFKIGQEVFVVYVTESTKYEIEQTVIVGGSEDKDYYIAIRAGKNTLFHPRSVFATEEEAKRAAIQRALEGGWSAREAG